MPLRFAMWSGPRNISTAMMRSWGNRPDTAVVDEPFYAHYLSTTGKPHPGAAEVIAAGEPDYRKVIANLVGPIPGGRAIWFQKHMTHHLLPHMERDWLNQLTNGFLIRHPRDVLNSYIKIVAEPAYEDTGFPQLRAIFHDVRVHSPTPPPVIDAADVLADPRRTLGLLCESLGVPFLESMLSWPAGTRSTDGIWAKHWYREVENSTEFRKPSPATGPLPSRLGDLYERCLADYEDLRQYRLH